MPIVMDWGDADDTFIIWRFDGTWTWNELYSVLVDLQTITAPKPVFDVLLDLRGCKDLQPNLLSHLIRIIKMLPQNHRDTVIVGDSHFLNTMHRMMQPHVTLPGAIHFAKTMDEAYELIAFD